MVESVGLEGCLKAPPSEVDLEFSKGGFFLEKHVHSPLFTNSHTHFSLFTRQKGALENFRTIEEPP
jgi:hypothetical protein